MATLDDIRQKLKALDEKRGGNKNNGEPTATYPFWDIPVGESVHVRFLPDADTTNTFFWRERQLINLDFLGVRGGDEHKPVTIKVPCVEMWGDTCPILREIRPWWNDSALKETARKYWKKRSYLFQALIMEDPMNKVAPENPIRKMVIGPQIFNIIKSALLDPDMEHTPTHYTNGTNFVISRTKKGEYSDYATSKYSRRESALTEEQLAAIEKHGLVNLNDWLPAKPTAEALNAIHEMFEASVNGDLYDPEKWGAYYKPYGLEINSSASVAQPEAKAKEEADDVPFEAEESVTQVAPSVKTDVPKKDVNDILAKIRARASQ